MATGLGKDEETTEYRNIRGATFVGLIPHQGCSIIWLRLGDGNMANHGSAEFTHPGTQQAGGHEPSMWIVDSFD